MLSPPSIELRPWRDGDEHVLARLGNNRAIWRNLTDRFPFPYTVEAGLEWLRIANLEPENQQNFAILHEGEVAGGVGFDRKEDLARRTAEVGYWLGEPFWGKGIATRALRQTIDIALREYDFVRLEANVLSWNPASCRVLEKNGFHLEATLKNRCFKDNEVCDLWLYARLR